MNMETGSRFFIACVDFVIPLSKLEYLNLVTVVTHYHYYPSYLRDDQLAVRHCSSHH
jgi:hypothetical protein